MPIYQNASSVRGSHRQIWIETHKKAKKRDSSKIGTENECLPDEQYFSNYINFVHNESLRNLVNADRISRSIKDGDGDGAIGRAMTQRDRLEG